MLKRLTKKFTTTQELDDVYVPMEEELVAPHKSEKQIFREI
jgi:hypothetical protein